MRRRKLGCTPIEVTELGFGGAPLGGFRTTLAETEAAAVLAAAWEAGIRLFDTAPLYGYGRSELRFGAFLREQPRDQFVLSSKVGRLILPARAGHAPGERFREGGLPGFVPALEYGYDGVLRSLEHSYARLGLARIDIVLIHDVDLRNAGDGFEARFRTAMAGFRALDELRRAGVIGAIGVGVNETGPALRFVREGDFDCVMLAGRYTLLEQGQAASEFLPLCAERGVGVLVAGPFNSGILAGPVRDGAWYDYEPAPPGILSRARRIETVCARHGVPLAAAALQFPLAHPAVSSVVAGALAAAEVRQNAALLEMRIPAALWDELRHEGLLDPAASTPGRSLSHAQ